MKQTAAALRHSLQRWQDAATAAPRLAASALGRGILPAGLSAAATLRKEGRSELHWKVLGDALVRFLRHSGPLFTKLGQLLATRSDLLPETVCARLEALYAGQPPMPDAALQRILKKAYPRRRPFRKLDPHPIGVGSIGQVHRGRLRNGKRVIVKIVRPGVARAVRRDINAARVLTELFFRVFARGDRSTRALIAKTLEGLGRELEAEVDLENEAAALEEFGRRFARNPRVCVPVCYRKWSSREILVLEELTGEPLAAIRRRGSAEPERAKAAADLALREILSQIFEEGRFHADPHGGNLLILDDGRLGLIDLGLTGELSVQDRRRITRAARAFLARDSDASIRALLEFGSVPDHFDLEAFKAEIRALFRAHTGDLSSRATGRAARDAGVFGLEEFVNALFRVTHRHEIHVPHATTLLIKTLVTIEGVARSLDPDINMMVAALPIILRSLTPKWLRWRPWRRPAA